LRAFVINPLLDPRWPDFLRRHSDATVFHTPGWLDALRRTYQYEPVVYTTSPLETDLTNGWAFCRVGSWLTGDRLVSLPFSDHCDLLGGAVQEFDCLSQELVKDQRQHSWKYLEFRPRAGEPTIPDGFQASETFCLHRIDLTPPIGQLFNNLHKDSTQRKIRRSEREGITCEEGRCEELVDKLYCLLLLTRRRHKIPPQPRGWFSNLVNCLGDCVKVRVVSKDGRPLAGILTLRFKDTLIYKYGGSDARFHSLGGIHLCFWRAIEDAKGVGLSEFDLGRSDLDDDGLITFKDRWGARRSRLTYYRKWLRSPRAENVPWQVQARRVLAYVPSGLLSVTGRLLYRHFG
jgi:hypothetical protein